MSDSIPEVADCRNGKIYPSYRRLGGSQVESLPGLAVQGVRLELFSANPTNGEPVLNKNFNVEASSTPRGIQNKATQ